MDFVILRWTTSILPVYFDGVSLRCMILSANIPSLLMDITYLSYIRSPYSFEAGCGTPTGFSIGKLWLS